MKAGAILISTGVCFVVGALCALEQGGERLHRSLRKGTGSGSDTGSGRNHKSVKGALPNERGGEDDLFTHVLSAMHGGSGLKQRHELSEVLESVTAGELAAMMERLEKLPADRAYLLRTPLLERWFELDPAAASAWLQQHSRTASREDWQVWGRLAPESALQEAHARPFSAYADALLSSAVRAVAGSEKKAIASHLMSLPVDRARDQLLTRITDEWAQTDAAGAFDFVRRQQASRMKDTLAETVLRQWLIKDAMSAADALTSILSEIGSNSVSTRLITLAAGTIAQKDPQRALEWIQQTPEASRSPAPIHAMATAWAKTDPLAALQWCDANGVNCGRGLVALPGGSLAGSIISAAMTADPIGTLNWIGAVPASDRRDALLERALGSECMLTRPPVSAENARLVAELIASLPADAQESAAFVIGRRTGRERKLENVTVWVDQFPDETTKAAAIEGALKVQAAGNPYQLEEYVSQFPEGYQRDAALRGFASAQPPADGVQTALQIGNPETRHLVLDIIISNWLRDAPLDARKWLQTGSEQIPAEWRTAWVGK